jgi:circadian clock protein KaiC
MGEVKSMLIRLIDFLQDEQITVMFTALTLITGVNEQADEGISSLVDTWLLVRDIESNGERNRGLYVIKARGMKHSNQVREFVITDDGLDLIDVYLGPDGVLTGSAREARKIEEETGIVLRDYALNVKDREIDRQRKTLEAKILNLKNEFESTEQQLNRIYDEEMLRKQVLNKTRDEMTRIRRGEEATEATETKKSKDEKR